LQLGELVIELAERVGLPEAADEVVEGGVADQVAASERFHRQPHGEMRLADAGRAENQAADLALDEPQQS
jgi:hypothetical protein